MLRSDGSYKIYRIQHLYKKKGNWAFSGDSLFANVPEKSRFSDTKTGKHRSPFHEFSASGDVWQVTGLHGTFDKSIATKVLKLVAEHNTEHSFRIVEMHISQRTEQIAMIN